MIALNAIYYTHTHIAAYNCRIAVYNATLLYLTSHHCNYSQYTRALNATKLERVFAKPFVAALSGHNDGVWCSATSPTSLVAFLSGATDGEVRIWDLPRRKTLWSVYAHSGFVRGIVVANNGKSFFTCR